MIETNIREKVMLITGCRTGLSIPAICQSDLFMDLVSVDQES